MKLRLSVEHRLRLERAFRRVLSAIKAGLAAMEARLSQTDVAVRIARRLQKQQPPLSITPARPPLLVVMMADTTARDYERAGQLGRLTSSLERYARHFSTVILMTNDRTDYTDRLSVERVVHLRAPAPSFLPASAALVASVLIRARVVRRATAVLILDRQAAPAGWAAGKISGSSLSMSVGAPWAPPHKPDLASRKHRLTRWALERTDRIIEWPGEEAVLELPVTERVTLPAIVDVDLFCPVTTTDPARPWTAGVFIDAGREADARVIIGVAETVLRRRQNIAFQVLLTGESAESRAATLQGELGGRKLPLEFLPLPPLEMLPGALARMRICVGFSQPEPAGNLLKAMSCGVPCIAINPEPGLAGATGERPDWTDFVLKSGPTQEEIIRNVDALLREPGVRLRMAREGRRFINARHSVDALAGREISVLLGPETDLAAGHEFNSAAEAEALAGLMRAAGVTSSDAAHGHREVAA